jgi:hypothetical protein
VDTDEKHQYWRAGGVQSRYFVRAYEFDKDGVLSVTKIVEAENEAASLALAETLCNSYAGAVAFALTRQGSSVMQDIGRYGQTPEVL